MTRNEPELLAHPPRSCLMSQTIAAEIPKEVEETVVPPVVALDHVSASYREGDALLPVLDDISLTVADGEFVALIGPSGSGKSTLLDVVAGLSDPDTGKVLLNGVTAPAPGRL